MSYSYSAYRPPNTRPKKKKLGLKKLLAVFLAVLAAFVVYKLFVPTPVEKAANNLLFDASVSAAEKATIQNAIKTQSKTYKGEMRVSTATTTEASSGYLILSAYVPVTSAYSTRQSVSLEEMSQMSVFVPNDLDEKAKTGLAALLKTDPAKIESFSQLPNELSENSIALINPSHISPKVKLLSLDGKYYLDSFVSGAVFRQAQFSGESAASLADLKLNELESKDTVLKVNMTGVTALTREMMKKLNSTKDATYFSEKIGLFLADADITHVSNEVSFKEGCSYSSAVFCSPPEMIETLKDSGVDLVELTGNHNNDVGNQYNTETINLYHSLGWGTFGGGLNKAEAAKPFVADQKGSKVAFLGYNYPDSPNGTAIATTSNAGANSFDYEKIKSDIDSAKGQGSFVIVDVQFWECYAYPAGYVEFPECDHPIGSQQEVFRKIADLGADMVIGTQAHQPQTYETYQGKPIYYGLGNMYFDQTQWPGTERGLILTHYFVRGKLVQTKLSPTVYDKALQTRLMTDSEATELLDRLDSARP